MKSHFRRAFGDFAGSLNDRRDATRGSTSRFAFTLPSQTSYRLAAPLIAVNQGNEARSVSLKHPECSLLGATVS